MSHSLEALLLGRRLVERYEVEEVIGRGGMSIVYRARDQRLGRPVALKIVALPAHGSAERASLRERFRREAGSAARIPPHPNVVQVYDYGTDPELDLDFIVMELLVGRDLKAAMAGRHLSDAEAMRVMREAARGVAAGHRVGILHRDVKPANIFLFGENRVEQVKILDFGIAKALELASEEDLTLAGELPHSPAWSSPEQRRPGDALTPASDVYQLGLVAYELFTGERAFNEEQRKRLIAGEELRLPARGAWNELAPELRETIARALRPSPGERYPDAASFAEALGQVREDWRTAGDETLLHAADDHTMIAPAPVPVPPPRRRAAPDAPPPLTRGSAGAPPPPRRHLPRWMARQLVKVAAGLALVAAALWGLGIVGGGDAGEADAPAVASADPAEAVSDEVTGVEREFRGLYHRAHRNLLEEGSGQEGEAAAEAVGRVLADVQEAFIRGELERHLAHYAPRVDFYTVENAPRSRVESERRADLERFPEREIVLDRQAIEFPEPGRARALVDRSWTFSGGEERWTGSGRQEFILELRDGRWLIVSEKDLEVYRSSRERV